MHFAQIGPPRNLTVQQTDAGDEFVASWKSPEYGTDTLAVYVLRWHRQPGYKFEGSLETRNTYVHGKNCISHFSNILSLIELSFIFQFHISSKMKCTRSKYFQYRPPTIKPEAMNLTYEYHNIEQFV